MILFIGLWPIGNNYAQDSSGSSDASFNTLKNISINLHKENYFFPGYHNSSKASDTLDATDLKYQFSVKLSLVGEGHNNISLAYTQKSFWQAYAGSRSAPFRETNYNPEAYIQLGGASFFVNLGYEHESNGQAGPESRTWDRAYISFNLHQKFYKISYKAWSVLYEEVHGPAYRERKTNIKRYYGNGELSLTLKFYGMVIKNIARYNFNTHYGYTNPMLLFKMNKYFYLALTYSHGYGDNLRDYNKNLETYGIGLLVNP